jgi:erythromycin esterase
MSGRALALFGSLALLGALPGCSPATLRSGEGAEPPSDPQTAWLRSHAHSISLPGDGFADLEFLRPLLDGKRVIQLGENTHGTAEYNLVKSRIVRFLHQELDYDVLVFESALYQCYDADRTAGEASALSTLTGCAFGVWHTHEVLPLFEYLRTTRTSARPLHLAGIDIQPIGTNKDDRPQFLSSLVAVVDTDYAVQVSALDSTFLDVYARGGRERRAYFRTDEGRRMAEAYDHLAALLADKEAAIRGAPDGGDPAAIVVARQTARSMARYIRQQAAPTTREYVEVRDLGMAENLTVLLDELYPDRKVVVWGHNFHLRHANLEIPPDTTMFPDVAARTMGAWIHERYGDELYTIGLYAYRGEAADNGGELYRIEPAEPGSLEALFQGLGPGAHFVDLSRAIEGPGTDWIDTPITARYDGTIPLSIVPRDQYDAIIVVGEVTPRQMLY